jgi:hypothetical protein
MRLRQNPGYTNTEKPGQKSLWAKTRILDLELLAMCVKG